MGLTGMCCDDAETERAKGDGQHGLGLRVVGGGERFCRSGDLT